MTKGKTNLETTRVPPKVLVLFARQLVTLLGSGCPLIRSLDCLSYQPECAAFGEVVEAVQSKIESGCTFSFSLSKYPRVFSRVFIVMVELGERSGRLEAALERLAGWLERDQNLREKIQSAVAYPAFISLVAAVLTLGMFYGVLPCFLKVFADMHVELPWITRMVMMITELVRSPLFWIVLLGAGGGLFWRLREWNRTCTGAARLFSTLLRTPLIGPVAYHATCARYSATLSTLLEVGADLLSSVRLAAVASGSPLCEQDAPHVVKTLGSGAYLSEHLSQHPGLYSNVLTNFVRVGEETSQLAEMLDRAALFHNLELETRIEGLSVAIEPLLLASVALVVGTVVISMFLPLYGFLAKF